LTPENAPHPANLESTPPVKASGFTQNSIVLAPAPEIPILFAETIASPLKSCPLPIFPVASIGLFALVFAPSLSLEVES